MTYKLVATLGPASSQPASWAALLAAGATTFRLNTSHLTLPELAGWLERLEPFLAGCQPRPALVLDLQGSKWRLGDLSTTELKQGQQVEFVLDAESGSTQVLPVPHRDFFEAAGRSSGEIALNDGRVKLVVQAAGAASIKALVSQGGPVSSRKGITYTASTYRIETANEKDRAIVSLTGGLAGVRYALSYVRDGSEMARYRALFGSAAYVIAKIERQPAIDEAGLIAEAADELWLCRGDLGAELGLPGMAAAAHAFSSRLAELPVPALLAGQVLEHMSGWPLPTRAEVCGLYDALLGGYAGVVLSDETAIGQYPVESCRAAAMFQGSLYKISPRRTRRSRS